MSKKNIHAAGQLNKNFSPYFYQSYTLPQQVKARFPKLNITYPTPAFTREEGHFTTQEELMKFLYELSADTEHMQLEIIGNSLEGREIPMVIFTTNKDEEEMKDKPTVWLQANVHGHEPASGESALVIIHQLAKEALGEEILPYVNVVVVPRINPDSVFYHEQKSPLRINGNRDHVQLEMPELQALHQAYNRFEAEVVIDAHEYDADIAYPHVGKEGALKYHDLLILSGKNLNIPAEIRLKSDEWFLPDVFSALDAEGISNGTYFTVSHTENNEVVVHEGGGDIGIGRNAFALKPSFCFLTESLGISIGRENFLRRVTSQVITHTSILRTTKKHAAEIKTLIAEAKLELVDQAAHGEENRSIVLQSEAQEMEGLTVEAVDIATGDVIEIPVTYYDETEAVPTLERKLPNAYLLPPAYQGLIERLVMQGVVVDRLVEEEVLTVECYDVHKISGKCDQLNIETEIVEREVRFPKGSYVISCAQRAGSLIALALEPESSYSFVSKNYFHVEAGEEVPIYRYLGETHTL